MHAQKNLKTQKSPKSGKIAIFTTAVSFVASITAAPVAALEFNKMKDKAPPAAGELSAAQKELHVPVPPEKMAGRSAQKDTTNLGTYNVLDPWTGDNYKERVSVSGMSSMTYDGAKGIVNNPVSGYEAYRIEFDSCGLPITTVAGSTDPLDRTDNHNVLINFLGPAPQGQNWIVSKLDTTENTVKLAQESAYGILNVGDIMHAGDINIRLDDISVSVGPDNVHPAIISVLDSATGNVLKQCQINPGDTRNVMVNGNTYGIHVFQTAPGFLINSKWAEMAVFNKEIALTQGTANFPTTSDDFNVDLVWTTRGDGVRCLKKIEISNTTTGVGEGKVAGRTGVTVTPTVANTHVSFGYKGPIDSKAELRIYDISGRLVKKAKFGESPEIEVNVSDMRAGVYLATFTINNGKKWTEFTVVK